MDRLIDLHLHSNYSDGAHSPARLVEMARAAGLAAIAIADHDNIDGIEEAMAAGRRLQVEVIPGVELSVLWEEYRDIHLLGYCFDPCCPALGKALREFRTFRAHRNEQIVGRINDRLRQEGRPPIDFAEVRQLAEGSLGRPHIGLLLMAKGYVTHMEEAFQRYLVPCNVPKRYFPVEQAIELIHDAGGVTSLAHPFYTTTDRSELQRLLDRFVALGLDGLEAYNNQAANNDIDWLITQARRRELFVTGGTDFHGSEGESLILGGIRGNLRIPYSCLEVMRRKASSVRPR